jgi:hypothetical protein
VVGFTLLPLYTQGTAPGTHCVGDWVDLRAGLDVLDKRRSLSPVGNRTKILQSSSPFILTYTICENIITTITTTTTTTTAITTTSSTDFKYWTFTRLVCKCNTDIKKYVMMKFMYS